MKEFDYEKAKKGAAVCTREGYPVRIICWDFRAEAGLKEDYKIIALIDYGDYEEPELYNCKGKRWALHGDDWKNLMMVPVKHEGWLYLYDDGPEVCTSHCVFRTKEDASKAAKEIVRDGETQIIKIEWEE